MKQIEDMGQVNQIKVKEFHTSLHSEIKQSCLNELERNYCFTRYLHTFIWLRKNTKVFSRQPSPIKLDSATDDKHSRQREHYQRQRSPAKFRFKPSEYNLIKKKAKQRISTVRNEEEMYRRKNMKSSANKKYLLANKGGKKYRKMNNTKQPALSRSGTKMKRRYTNELTYTHTRNTVYPSDDQQYNRVKTIKQSTSKKGSLNDFSECKKKKNTEQPIPFRIVSKGDQSYHTVFEINTNSADADQLCDNQHQTIKETPSTDVGNSEKDNQTYQDDDLNDRRKINQTKKSTQRRGDWMKVFSNKRSLRKYVLIGILYIHVSMYGASATSGFSYEPPPSINKNEGEFVTLTCSIANTDKSNGGIWWTKDAKMINSTLPNYQHHELLNIPEENQYMLIINPIQRGDEGTYTCILEQTLTFSSGTYLSVKWIPGQQYPKIIFAKETYQVGEVIIAYCISEQIKDPQPQLSWFDTPGISESFEEKKHIGVMIKMNASREMNQMRIHCQMIVNSGETPRTKSSTPISITEGRTTTATFETNVQTTDIVNLTTTMPIQVTDPTEITLEIHIIIYSFLTGLVVFQTLYICYLRKKPVYTYYTANRKFPMLPR